MPTDARNLCWNCHQEQCDCHNPEKMLAQIRCVARSMDEHRDWHAANYNKRLDNLSERVKVLEEAHQITVDGILRERIESDAECSKLMQENARLQRELDQALSCDWQGVERDKITEERDEAREIVLELIPLVKGFFDGQNPGFPFGIAMRLAILPWVRDAVGKGKFG